MQPLRITLTCAREPQIHHTAGPFVPVQPEMERERSPLVSPPPFGRRFSRHGGSTDPMKLGGDAERCSDAPASSSRRAHRAIPRHGCFPAEPASVSPGNISVTATGLFCQRCAVGSVRRLGAGADAAGETAPVCGPVRRRSVARGPPGRHPLSASVRAGPGSAREPLLQAGFSS